MTLNKLTFVLTGMFVTGAVFLSILLQRSQEVHAGSASVAESPEHAALNTDIRSHSGLRWSIPSSFTSGPAS
jgi:hypothetical protein